MSRILGEDYKATDTNRRHIVKNVIMQYISTGNVCLIYIPNNYSKNDIILNDEPISIVDKAYMERFMSKKKTSTSVIEYRTLSLKNIKSISINKEKYDVEISDWTVREAA